VFPGNGFKLTQQKKVKETSFSSSILDVRTWNRAACGELTARILPLVVTSKRFRTSFFDGVFHFLLW